MRNPELFGICARRMSTQELLEWVEWLPRWAGPSLRLARQILFDRVALSYEAPPELLELPVEEKVKKSKHSPETLQMAFQGP